MCVNVQEMLKNQHVVTQETFHYLLMGCVMEKETGFRQALQVGAVMHVHESDRTIVIIAV